MLGGLNYVALQFFVVLLLVALAAGFLGWLLGRRSSAQQQPRPPQDTTERSTPDTQSQPASSEVATELWAPAWARQQHDSADNTAAASTPPVSDTEKASPAQGADLDLSAASGASRSGSWHTTEELDAAEVSTVISKPRSREDLAEATTVLEPRSFAEPNEAEVSTVITQRHDATSPAPSTTEKSQPFADDEEFSAASPSDQVPDSPAEVHSIGDAEEEPLVAAPKRNAAEDFTDTADPSATNDTADSATAALYRPEEPATDEPDLSDSATEDTRDLTQLVGPALALPALTSAAQPQQRPAEDSVTEEANSTAIEAVAVEAVADESLAENTSAQLADPDPELAEVTSVQPRVDQDQDGPVGAAAADSEESEESVDEALMMVADEQPADNAHEDTDPLLTAPDSSAQLEGEPLETEADADLSSSTEQSEASAHETGLAEGSELDSAAPGAASGYSTPEHAPEVFSQDDHYDAESQTIAYDSDLAEVDTAPDTPLAGEESADNDLVNADELTTGEFSEPGQPRETKTAAVAVNLDAEDHSPAEHAELEDDESDLDEDTLIMRVQDLREQLDLQARELARLETGATSAWDRTVPQMERRIDELLQERSELQEELRVAALRIEEQELEIQQLRGKLEARGGSS